MKPYDIVIIGGGAGGVAALKSAYDESLRILLIERDKTLGGILKQCIHNGFGLHHYKEELTGPEYAERGIREIEGLGADVLVDTTVMDVNKENGRFSINVINTDKGAFTLESKAVILSSGCYERTSGAIQLPGDRPAGIMPAGSAQRYLNIDGYLVGRKVFILGSGDIGLIMARRMRLEGADVLGVAELMPHSNGLTRNIVQCLHDFDIPLYLSHTVTDIRGESVLEGITISEVDEQFNAIEGSEKHFEVDTLLLSVGLIPDIGMFDSLKFDISPKTNGAIVDHTYQTSIEGLFACGNALHVHDLVDFVTEEATKAGKQAKDYILKNKKRSHNTIDLTPKGNISYLLPQKLDMGDAFEEVTVSFRTTTNAMTGKFHVYQGDTLLFTKKAKFIVPAEMEKLTIKRDQLINKDPINIEFEVINV